MLNWIILIKFEIDATITRQRVSLVGNRLDKFHHLFWRLISGTIKEEDFSLFNIDEHGYPMFTAFIVRICVKNDTDFSLTIFNLFRQIKVT